jgi:hypothetical protein
MLPLLRHGSWLGIASYAAAPSATHRVWHWNIAGDTLHHGSASRCAPPPRPCGTGVGPDHPLARTLPITGAYSADSLPMTSSFSGLRLPSDHHARSLTQ